MSTQLNMLSQRCPSLAAKAPATKEANDRIGAIRTLLSHVAAPAAAGMAIGGGITGLSGYLKSKNRKVPASNEVEDVPLHDKKAAGPLWSALAQTVGKARKSKTPSGAPTMAELFRGNVSSAPPPAFDMAGSMGALKHLVPWAAGTAGVMGGSALAQHLWHKHMKHKQDQELEAAKSQFNESIMPPKTANAAAPGAPSPQAIAGMVHSDHWGQLPGAMALGGMGLLTALSAVHGYRTAHNRSNENMLAKAVKNKQYLESLRGPAPVHLVADEPTAEAGHEG